jgi:hypothetical protein
MQSTALVDTALNCILLEMQLHGKDLEPIPTGSLFFKCASIPLKQEIRDRKDCFVMHTPSSRPRPDTLNRTTTPVPLSKILNEK